MSNLVQRAHVEGSGHFGVERWIVEGTAVYGLAGDITCTLHIAVPWFRQRVSA
jgi:hypothetical protein